MMKLVIVACLSVGMVACQSTTAQNVGKSSTIRGEEHIVDGSRYRMVVQEKGLYLEMEYAGNDADIRFNDTETAIAFMSPKSSFKYEKGNIRITAKLNKQGEVVYEIYEGRTTLAFDERAQGFLKEAIQEAIAHGADAQRRVKRLMNSGGVELVVAETGKLKSDFAKKLYLEYALEKGSLAGKDLNNIAKAIQLISSDFEKSQLLGKFSASFSDSPEALPAYIQATKGIGSDFEKANVLKQLLKKPLQESVLLQTLDIVGTIGSDFEKAGVLKSLLHNSPLSGTQFDKMLAVTQKIGSDFEKAQVLKTVAHSKLTEEKQWINLLNTAASIGSDFEKAETMLQIAHEMPNTTTIKDTYKKVAKGIGSEFEYGKVMKAVD